MRLLDEQSKYRFATVVLVFLTALFLASLFKNIAYPLFWADEGMTVMGGTRVLEYGYPKVHDGKNVFYDLLHPDTSLGVDEKTDAYIGGAGWGQYYFATLGIKLAEMSEDFFTKTAVIRITFALTGLAGLAILALVAVPCFHTRLSKAGFLTFFVFFEAISVPLVLHLREARYYPLTIFFTALTIFAYVRYRILKDIGYPTYAILMIGSLFLLFVTLPPAYFVFLIALSLFESMLVAQGLLSGYGGMHQGDPNRHPSRKALFKEALRSMLPVTLSAIAVSPLISFFRTFSIAGEIARFNLQVSGTDAWGMFRSNLGVMWRFFTVSDFAYLAIALKIALLCCLVLKRASKGLPSFDRSKLALSGFLTLFFIVYFICIGKIPNFAFTRYFILLQPVLALIIILDIAAVYNFISLSGLPAAPYVRGLVVALVAVFILVNVSHNANHLKGHLYELSHQYRGPLDYVIPFIKERYAHTSDLVIATNYEETSFMYYLNAKVIIGYVGTNLNEDLRTVPDIIVYRKLWANFGPVFAKLLEQRAYERISFPVLDYPVNNIPELNFRPPFEHLFRTIETANEREKVDMYVRK